MDRKKNEQITQKKLINCAKWKNFSLLSLASQPDICRCIVNDVSVESERGQTGETFRRAEEGLGQQGLANHACHSRAAAVLEGVHKGNAADVSGGAWKWTEFTVGCRYMRLQRSERRNALFTEFYWQEIQFSILIFRQTHVIFPHYVLSNKESYFPEPTKFIPERWLKNEEQSQKDIHRFVSLPFGYGRRTCIGRRFAEAELAILLSKVFVPSINLSWNFHHIFLPAFHRFSANITSNTITAQWIIASVQHTFPTSH